MIRTEAEIIKEWDPNAGGGAYFPAEATVGSRILVEIYDYDNLRWCVNQVDTKVPPECVRLIMALPEKRNNTINEERSMSEQTPEEKNREENVMEHLVVAWNSFSKLPVQHPDDTDEFRHAIHRLQHLIMIRQVRRDNPDTYHMENHD